MLTNINRQSLSEEDTIRANKLIYRFTYESLSESELYKYRRFLEHPSAKKLNHTLSIGLNEDLQTALNQFVNQLIRSI